MILKKITTYLLYLLLKLLLKTYRLRYNFEAFPDEAHILCCWHEYLLGTVLAVLGKKDTRFRPLISQSKDGEWIAQVVEYFGYKAVRGSSRRGGLRAKALLTTLLQERECCVGMTVDGPKGPRHKSKRGAIVMASETGVPLYPLTAYSKKAYIFHKSWDHFHLPLPFSTLHIKIGRPLWIPPQLDDEETQKWQEQLDKEINRLEEKDS